MERMTPDPPLAGAALQVWQLLHEHGAHLKRFAGNRVYVQVRERWYRVPRELLELYCPLEAVPEAETDAPLPKEPHGFTLWAAALLLPRLLARIAHPFEPETQRGWDAKPTAASRTRRNNRAAPASSKGRTPDSTPKPQ